jgi:predicted DNA-binding transcriptional regulator AlpA
MFTPANQGTSKFPRNTPPAAITATLTVADLARILQVDRRTVQRLRNARKFPPPDFELGRLPRWFESTISEWLTNGGTRTRA